jgi:hypothetical protein
MPSKKFQGELSAFLRLLNLQQMSGALDETVVISALESERSVRGVNAGLSLTHFEVGSPE